MGLFTLPILGACMRVTSLHHRCPLSVTENVGEAGAAEGPYKGKVRKWLWQLNRKTDGSS